MEKDRPILAAAIAARATDPLTGDVRHFGPFYGVTIEGVLVLPPNRYRVGEGLDHGPAGPLEPG